MPWILDLYIYIFAAETTAHTLVVTLALLGIYQEEQTRVHNHIWSILNSGKELVGVSLILPTPRQN